jgi:hypothetical protein
MLNKGVEPIDFYLALHSILRSVELKYAESKET